MGAYGQVEIAAIERATLREAWDEITRLRNTLTECLDLDVDKRIRDIITRNHPEICMSTMLPNEKVKVED